MKIQVILLLLPLISNTACMSPITELTNPDVEVIGHRGHVSAYPENTIEGFLSAVAIGAGALELDLVISADQKVVVSHEPYMKAAYMLTPDGKRINKKKEREYNLFEMSYDSIRKYKSGRITNSKFRMQRQTDAHKPLLDVVIDTVMSFTKNRDLEPVTFFLEIKSDPADYGKFQPQPEEFVTMVMKILEEKKLEDRVVLMSFDSNILHAVKERYPHINVSYLLYRKRIDEGLKELNFQPEYIGPYHKQLSNTETVTSLQQKGIKVVPWTVNRRRDILKMFGYGVDGIISDHPERVLQEKNRLKAE